MVSPQIPQILADHVFHSAVLRVICGSNSIVGPQMPQIHADPCFTFYGSLRDLREPIFFHSCSVLSLMHLKSVLMFTLHDIKEAHAKVSTGADFPAYIEELRGMGVTGYSTYVSDGHTAYTGSEGFSLESDAKYASQDISQTADA